MFKIQKLQIHIIVYTVYFITRIEYTVYIINIIPMY